MSAYPSTPDIAVADWNVAYVPQADINLIRVIACLLNCLWDRLKDLKSDQTIDTLDVVFALKCKDGRLAFPFSPFQ